MNALNQNNGGGPNLDNDSREMQPAENAWLGLAAWKPVEEDDDEDGDDERISRGLDSGGGPGLSLGDTWSHWGM